MPGIKITRPNDQQKEEGRRRRFISELSDASL